SLLSCRLVGPQVSLTEAAPHAEAAVHSKVHGRLCGPDACIRSSRRRRLRARSHGSESALQDRLLDLGAGLGDLDAARAGRAAREWVAPRRPGNASVQMKVVRQPHTPSFSLRISRRVSPPSSRESKMKRCALTIAAGPKYCPSVQNTGHDEVQAAQRMHFVVSSKA